MFIAFEGIDATGKTTLSHAAADALREQHRVRFVDEFVPEYLDGYLMDRLKGDPFLSVSNRSTRICDTILLLGMHTFKYMEMVHPNLNGEDIVIMDRYLFSVQAYQSVVFSGRHAYIDSYMFKLIAYILDRLPLPDITIYLTCDNAILRKRWMARKYYAYPYHEHYLRMVAVAYEHIFRARSANTIEVSTTCFTKDLDIIVRVLNDIVRMRS
jgi:thymidylate kinase